MLSLSTSRNMLFFLVIFVYRAVCEICMAASEKRACQTKKLMLRVHGGLQCDVFSVDFSQGHQGGDSCSWMSRGHYSVSCLPFLPMHLWHSAWWAGKWVAGDGVALSITKQDKKAWRKNSSSLNHLFLPSNMVRVQVQTHNLPRISLWVPNSSFPLCITKFAYDIFVFSLLFCIAF